MDVSMAEKIPASDPGVALALGSAFLGMYAHAGFLCGLNALGIFPGKISGSSAGAIAGAFYAAGFRGDRLKEAIHSQSFKRSFTDPGMFIRWLPMMLGAKLSGAMTGKRMIQHLRQTLPYRRIEELSDVKLSLAVTDLRTREGIFLTRGPLADSIMASCAVPLLFTGQTIESRQFHDGGIIHEIPIEIFIDAPEVHTIIVHHLKRPRDPRKRLKLPSVFTHSHQMLNQSLFDHRLAEAERCGKRVIVIETTHPGPGLFQSQAKKDRYFDLGQKAAQSVTQAIHS